MQTQTNLRQVVRAIVNSLQLNVTNNTVVTFEKYKGRKLLHITNVVFNNNKYLTFEDFKEEVMHISNIILNVAYFEGTVTVSFVSL